MLRTVFAVEDDVAGPEAKADFFKAGGVSDVQPIMQDIFSHRIVTLDADLSFS